MIWKKYEKKFGFFKVLVLQLGYYKSQYTIRRYGITHEHSYTLENIGNRKHYKLEKDIDYIPDQMLACRCNQYFTFNFGKKYLQIRYSYIRKTNLK